MRLLIGVLVICCFITSAYALEYDKAIHYINKKVLITYTEFGANITDYGKVIAIIKDDKDFTIDKIYSLFVLYNYKAELKTIKISKIKYIKEIK